MNTNISFRHMDSSPALRDYATRKLNRVVDKYVNGKVDADVVMSVEKFRHIVNFTVQIKNLTVKCDSSSEDMYSSIDLAMDKLERQLRRHKERIHGRRTKGRGRPFRMSVIRPPEQEEAIEETPTEQVIQSAMPVTAPVFEESVETGELVEDQVADSTGDAMEDDDGYIGVFTTGAGNIELSRATDYEAVEMEMADAVSQLATRSDRAFFVFTNTATERINIVYRRDDGNFGLIET